MSSKILDDFEMSETRWSGGLIKGPKGATISGNAITTDLHGNWSGYQSLQFTIYNPSSAPVIGSIEIWDKEAQESPDREFGDVVKRGRSLLACEGITHVVIQIDPIQTNRGDRMLNLEEIVQVSIHFPEPSDGEEAISIAALRLAQTREHVDDEVNVKPGDAILFIRHLDISCYTYKPELFEDPEDVKRLEREVIAEKEALQRVVDVAEMNGKQTLYEQAALIAADIALKTRPMLAWHFAPSAKRRNLQEALQELKKHRKPLEELLSSKQHEDDEDDSNLPLPLVKPVPDLSSLVIDGKSFVDKSGDPVLVCSMSYHNEGALMKFFAPEQHKIEIYAVGGGSRYDIEWSPVYDAFHKYPHTSRVGWKGWCGHLIKDQWAMGGRKENVVICLENEHILEAIDAYNKQHAADWRHLPHLMYTILGYELTYMCYCEDSIARFQAWLEQRHGHIDQLNQRWGTTYSSFSEAMPPRTEGMAPVQGANRAAWFDWADWNTRRFTDHLKWSKESVRKLHPTIPLTAGGTSSMFSPNNGTTGIDEEMIINEVDDVILHEGNDLLGVDLFHALAEKPKPLVDPEMGKDCSRWMLNYLHGKTALSKFWWPKQPSRQFPSSTMGSPAHGNMSIGKVAEHLYTALDVRRLNKEITAFWDIPKEVAILYSKTNILQVPPALMTASTTPYLDALRASYDASRCLDVGITFISEKQLLAGNADKFKLIVIPAAKYIPETVFSAIDRYVRGGGRVLVMPESFTHDEYNRPQDYLQRWGIEIDRVETPELLGYGELTQRYDQNLERDVKYDQGTKRQAVQFDLDFAPIDLTVSGIFQYVTMPSGTVLAADEQKNPLLIKKRLDQGTVWYLTGNLVETSLQQLLDRLFSEAKLDRPLTVTDISGNRIPGLEARLVRRTFDDLVYVANESGKTVDFHIHTKRSIDEIRELRSLNYYAVPQGTIEDKQTLLFSLREDPSVRIRSK